MQICIPVWSTPVINDIVDDIQFCELFLFADDSKLCKLIQSKEDQEQLQKVLETLEDWSRKWLLRFHPGKCHVLSLGDSNAPLPDRCHAATYELEHHKLETVFEERDLGVIVDNELSFTQHIEMKISKANSTLGLIRRTFTFLDLQTLLALYKAFVRPQLEYAQAVWYTQRAGLATKLENVQMRALNFVR